MLDTAAAAAAAAAGTWTDSAPHQPCWLITRQQDHPHRVSDAGREKRRSHQRRHWTSPEWGSSTRLQFQVLRNLYINLLTIFAVNARCHLQLTYLDKFTSSQMRKNLNNITNMSSFFWPCSQYLLYFISCCFLGPFYGAIAVPSVTRCRCRRRRRWRRRCHGHRCAGGVNSDTWWMARAAARSGEWAQHFSNASCLSQQFYGFVLCSCAVVFIPPSHSCLLYVYNGCLAWYNVVLYNCFSWYKSVNTHLYHSRQLYNIKLEHQSVRCCNFCALVLTLDWMCSLFFLYTSCE